MATVSQRATSHRYLKSILTVSSGLSRCPEILFWVSVDCLAAATRWKPPGLLRAVDVAVTWFGAERDDQVQ